MRIKCDESLPRQALRLFQLGGHDAHSVHEEGLNGKGGPLVAEACLAEGRILVTLDVGFGDVRVYPPSEYPGMLRPAGNGPKFVCALVQRLMARLRTELIVGRLWIVSESRIRILS